jgi:hypothetical protein
LPDGGGARTEVKLWDRGRAGTKEELLVEEHPRSTSERTDGRGRPHEHLGDQIMVRADPKFSWVRISWSTEILRATG